MECPAGLDAPRRIDRQEEKDLINKEAGLQIRIPDGSENEGYH